MRQSDSTGMIVICLTLLLLVVVVWFSQTLGLNFTIAMEIICKLFISTIVFLFFAYFLNQNSISIKWPFSLYLAAIFYSFIPALNKWAGKSEDGFSFIEIKWYGESWIQTLVFFAIIGIGLFLTYRSER